MVAKLRCRGSWKSASRSRVRRAAGYHVTYGKLKTQATAGIAIPLTLRIILIIDAVLI